MSAHETPFGAGAIDRIAEQVEQLRAELERQRARAEKLEKALRDAEAQLASGKPGHAQATIVAALAPEGT